MRNRIDDDTESSFLCGLVVAEICDFSQVVYRISGYEKEIDLIKKSITRFYHDVCLVKEQAARRRAGEVRLTRADCPVQIMTAKANGFTAFVRGKDPVMRTLEFARDIQHSFKKDVNSLLPNLPFRIDLRLKIGLHFGRIRRLEIPCLGLDSPSSGLALKVKMPPRSQLSSFIYLGDDLNLAERVIASKIAEQYDIVVTRDFLNRMKGLKRKAIKVEKEEVIPDEMLLDRNQYPQQIEIFALKSKRK